MSDSHNTRLQKVLMGIIEGFSDYFITELTKRHGKTPTKIEVRNITVEKRLGATGIHIVKVMLESEFGKDIASIAVKIYKENEKKVYCNYCKEWIEIDDKETTHCYGDGSEDGIICECCGRIIFESK